MRCITTQYSRQTTYYCLVWCVGRVITMLENLIYVYYMLNIIYIIYIIYIIKVNERNLDWIEFTTKVNCKLRIENQVSGILL